MGAVFIVWQQLVIAAIVAVVFAQQLSVGPVFLGPEFALLIGNAVAFLPGQRRGVRLRFEGIRQLSPTSAEVTFTQLAPVRFLPGQYMELSLPHARADLRGVRRIFSITSAPQDSRSVSFGLRLSDPGSSFKNALVKLKPGTEISATTAAGRSGHCVAEGLCVRVACIHLRHAGCGEGCRESWQRPFNSEYYAAGCPSVAGDCCRAGA